MSKKLKAAMMANQVSVRNKTGVYVRINYLNRDLKQAYEDVPPHAVVEIAPRLTDAVLLERSNLETLVRGTQGRSKIEII